MKSKKPTPGNARRALYAGLLFALAVSAGATAPATAYATGTTDGTASESVISNEKLDLRDLGVVTSVKSQSPWQTCWAFSAISAAETSILSKLGTTYASTGLDLSELQLADMTCVSGGVPESVAGSAQAGEGYYSDAEDPNMGINAGGSSTYAASSFAAGIGPVLESEAPYKNKEDAVSYLVSGGEFGDQLVELSNPTEEDIKEYEAKGCTVRKVYYSGTYYTRGSATENSKLTYGDWSVDQSLWTESIYELENGNILPATRTLDSSGNCTGIDEAGIKAVKSELEAGRAVSCAIHADQSVPGASTVPGEATYLNSTNWAHYTYNTVVANHAVTIVGYDDTYSAANFGDGDLSSDTTPVGDGAWLCKNSFGSEGAEFPNTQYVDWGLEDEDGNHSGYFWVSYYDKSISSFETYDFDVTMSNTGASSGRVIDQYDYLPANGVTCRSSSVPMSYANIFNASSDMAVRALWSLTYSPNTTVTYDVYLLDDEATDPTDSEHATKVYSATETYEYGGYHRCKIADESDWIALRKDDRYSVVVTEKCQDSDGKWVYTVPITYNMGVSESYEYDPDTGEVASTIHSGYVSKVNAGESWVTTSVADWTGDSEEVDNSSWTDWSLVTAALTEKNPTTVFDNASVKVYGQTRSWASVDDLASLDEKISAAEALLAEAKISADGSDVSSDAKWMTQEEHDALTESVQAAKDLLAKAGDYRNELTNTTPTPDEVSSVLSSISYEEKAGTKQAGESSSQKKSDTGKKKGGVPATGDATTGAAVVGCALSGSALLFARRRRC